MKKNITIPNVDTELYEAVKERCRQDGTSISAYFNSLLAGQNEKPLVRNQNEEITRLQNLVDEYSTENAGLLQELHENSELLTKRANTISELSKTIAEQKNTIAEQQSKITDIEDYEASGKALLDKAEELEQKLAAKDTELERVKQELEETHQQNESLRTLSTNSVTVPLSPLEYALINHVTAKESKKHKKDITPALLLKTMFSEYCIHGETWFFDFPKRSEIKALQKQIEESKENNDTQEEATDENE